MAKKYSAHDIINKLPKYLKLETNTYKDTRTKALFIDDQFGEWWVLPSSVLAGKKHPKRSIQERPKTNLKEDTIRKRLPSHIEIDISTYKNSHTKARFFDKEYGEFFMRPDHVFAGSGHIERGKKNNKQIQKILKKLV